MKLKIIIVVAIILSLLAMAMRSFTKEDDKMAKKYENIEETKMMTGFRWETMKDFISKKEKEPVQRFEIEEINSEYYKSLDGQSLSITWFGHSSSLVEIEGKLVLFDPVFSNNVGPGKKMGPKRFHKYFPISAGQLPYIDMVLITHDHFDHLDKETIIAIKDKVGQFIVPEGLTKYLIKWEVPENNITTLTWWDEYNHKNLEIICTPSRHFSGRGMFDRNNTLWCSYVIKGKGKSVFYSGDSGYQKDFRTIGDKYGPFDLSIMECGQYNEDWSQIHMMPSETVQASIDLQSKLVLPVHWGAFSLSVHAWYEPVELFTKEAELMQVSYITPKIGALTIIDENTNTKHWWEEYMD